MIAPIVKMQAWSVMVRKLLCCESCTNTIVQHQNHFHAVQMDNIYFGVQLHVKCTLK